MSTLKITCVGDGTVGKTSLLYGFANNQLPSEYNPTVYDNYTASLTFKNKSYTLGLWDTAGQDEFDSIRVLSYPDTDVFLICFSVCHPNSFKNIKAKWYPELLKNNIKAPIILVGTKIDLLENETFRKQMSEKEVLPISKDMATNLKNEIKAKYYLECSSITAKGVKEVFEKCIEVLQEPEETNLIKKDSKDLGSNSSSNKKCIIL